MMCVNRRELRIMLGFPFCSVAILQDSEAYVETKIIFIAARLRPPGKSILPRLCVGAGVFKYAAGNAGGIGH